MGFAGRPVGLPRPSGQRCQAAPAAAGTGGRSAWPGPGRVTSTKAVPCLAGDGSSPRRRCRRCCGSRLPVGLPASTQAGQVTRVGRSRRADARPPDSLGQPVLDASPAQLGQDRAGFGLGLHLRHAPDQQGHGHVVQRREFGQQVMELVARSPGAGLPATLCRRAHDMQRLAHQLDLTLGGAVQAAQMCSRCSARA